MLRAENHGSVLIIRLRAGPLLLHLCGLGGRLLLRPIIESHEVPIGVTAR